MFGHDYCGRSRGRFRKGFPETKAYMAMLRSRRRKVGSNRRTKKKGRGIIAMSYGGMFPKYGVKALETALTKARNNNTDVGIKMFKKKRVNMRFPLRDQYRDIVVDDNNNVVYRTRLLGLKTLTLGRRNMCMSLSLTHREADRKVLSSSKNRKYDQRSKKDEKFLETREL